MFALFPKKCLKFLNRHWKTKEMFKNDKKSPPQHQFESPISIKTQSHECGKRQLRMILFRGLNVNTWYVLVSVGVSALYMYSLCYVFFCIQMSFSLCVFISSFQFLSSCLNNQFIRWSECEWNNTKKVTIKNCVFFFF